MEQKSATDLAANLITDIKQTRKQHKPIDQRNADILLQGKPEKHDVPHHCCEGKHPAKQLWFAVGNVGHLETCWAQEHQEPPAPLSLDPQPCTAQGCPALPRGSGWHSAPWAPPRMLPPEGEALLPAAPQHVSSQNTNTAAGAFCLLHKFKLLPDWGFFPFNVAILAKNPQNHHS